MTKRMTSKGKRGKSAGLAMTELEKRAAFARRALAGLPEHLGERMDDLGVIMELLPPGNRVRRTALEMLVHLQMQRRLQSEMETHFLPRMNTD